MRKRKRISHLLAAALALLVTFGSTHRSAAQTPPDLPLLFSGPVTVQTRVKPPRYTTTQQILAMDADGSIRQLTLGSGAPSRPSWSPDHRYIAFIRGSLLTVMEAKGQPNGARVFAVCPTWSPDGTQLAFRRDVSGETSLYGITIGSDTATLLYPGQSFPNWAP